MPDLPDYYTLIQTLEAEAYSLIGGADASKPASPEVRDIYLATDTDKLWYCTVDAAWRGFFMSSRLLTANSILYATSDYTPAALSVAASRIVGRKAAGNIAAMTGAEALVVLGVTASAAELNKLDGVTATTAELSILHGVTADKDELNITDGLTATTAELNLLDLAGLTAGELLVATGAAAAAWQSTGVKLSAPDISGIVTAAAALTFPAFTLNGTVTLSGNIFDAGAGFAEIDSTGIALLLLKSTQDSADGATLYLRTNSANPAVGDTVGMIFAQGKDSGGAEQSYCQILFKIESPTADSEAGYMVFYNRVGAAWNTAMTLSSAGKLWLDAGLEVGGAIDMNSHKINELTDPTAAQDAATKASSEAASAAAVATHAALRTGIHGITVVRKTADETVNNSATLQNDDHLLFAIAANEVWEVDVHLIFNSSSTAHIKFAWSTPAACTGFYKRTDLNAAATTLTTEGNEDGENADAFFTLHVIVVNGANAGNLQFQWAQYSAEVSDTKVLTNSCLIAKRIA